MILVTGSILARPDAESQLRLADGRPSLSVYEATEIGPPTG